MSHVKIIDGAVAAYPYALSQLRVEYPDTSFPQPYELADLTVFGVHEVVEIDAPAFDPETQRIEELTPALVNDTWTQQWAVIDLDAEVIAANATTKEVGRIAALWQAAHRYEFEQISGSAVGLLAIGVMQGAPKCVAVQNWIKGIWALYYERKVNGDASTDYSICGTCPHSVPELMQELGF